MLRIFSILVLILFIALLPPAALAYVSQDAIPGDQLYPVKRKLEDIILSVASISPTTRAWYALAYSRRRYDETTSLINKKDNTAASLTLKELVDQTSSVASEIQQVNSASQKIQLKEQLNTSIIEYQKGLNTAKTQLGQNQQAVRPSPTPTGRGQTPSPTPAQTSNNHTISNEELQRQIDEANKKLQQINDKTQNSAGTTPPPSTDDSDLYKAISDLDGIDVAGLGAALNSSSSSINSLFGI